MMIEGVFLFFNERWDSNITSFVKDEIKLDIISVFLYIDLDGTVARSSYI